MRRRAGMCSGWMRDIEAWGCRFADRDDVVAAGCIVVVVVVVGGDWEGGTDGGVGSLSLFEDDGGAA